MNKLARYVLEIRRLQRQIAEVEQRLDAADEDNAKSRAKRVDDDRWLAVGALKNRLTDQMQALALEVINNFQEVSDEDLKQIAATPIENVSIRLSVAESETPTVQEMRDEMSWADEQALKMMFTPPQVAEYDELAELPHLPEQMVEGIGDEYIYQKGQRVRAMADLKLRDDSDSHWVEIIEGDLGTVETDDNDEEQTCVRWDKSVSNHCWNDEIELVEEDE